MKGKDVGGGQHLREAALAHAEPRLLGCAQDSRQVRVNPRAPERGEPLGHRPPDPPHADIADGLAGEFARAHTQSIHMPAALPQLGIGKGQALGGGQHEQNGMLGDSDGGALGRQGERQAAPFDLAPVRRVLPADALMMDDAKRLGGIEVVLAELRARGERV